MYEPLIKDGNKKFGNNRWLTYSLKIRRNVYLFSELEYENWLLIESNPRILEAGYDKKWLDDLEAGRIADGDLVMLGLGALIRANK